MSIGSNNIIWYADMCCCKYFFNNRIWSLKKIKFSDCYTVHIVVQQLFWHQFLGASLLIFVNEKLQMISINLGFINVVYHLEPGEAFDSQKKILGKIKIDFLQL